MAEPIDYTAFDLPQISEVMFYPQRVWGPPPEGASDHMIPVADGVLVSGRFYPKDKALPSILFFHGNGEVACQYDDIAPHYNAAGANLFVVDYRGYGRSKGGVPSFSRMIADARACYGYFKEMLASQAFTGPRFVKGRSLGCQSAVEVAARFQGELRGVISESGAATTERTAKRWGLDLDTPALREMVRLHREKVRSITLPLLVIHGEMDELIPVETAMELYNTVGSQDKTIEIIPQAGHNDLLWLGFQQYFDAVRSFLTKHGQ